MEKAKSSTLDVQLLARAIITISCLLNHLQVAIYYTCYGTSFFLLFVLRFLTCFHF